MRKLLLRTLTILCFFTAVGTTLLYFNQEKLIFFPQKLDKEYRYSSDMSFEEITIETEDHKNLNGLLFTVENSKGLVFYLHGNAGSLTNCGDVAKTYTDLNYDIFMLDYRGFGKSEGDIDSQQQIFTDIQTAYTLILKRYQEDKVIVLGYSIGTGLATHLAATNKPRLLVLQAPYYSLTDMMKRRYKYLPAVLLKYKFPTNELITACTMPIVIFHGTQDRIIPYESSLMLQKISKSSDQLITLKDVGHGGINSNPKFKTEIARILN
ncbi:alpha/beta hydrolase [Labilibaculum antarcticum]|uniref:Alpha/beta hydrolase n=1 Tax=Labilibaculum antarcticum TaxID=1717717 RepID=A0A1Y1CQI2_9BACT|nr:alpha/beta fold hydrolase [Labilibaculum antarcticum]BAX82677.1 alpha/beta hydrolase [Labilibaculum antarcticum]